jgi:hypothetical protein
MLDLQNIISISKRNILVVLLVVFVVIAAVAIFFQQRTIKRLGAEVRQAGITAPGTGATHISQDTAGSIKDELANLSDEILGKVISVSGKTIKIEAEIIDPDKVAQASSVATLPLIKRTYTVGIDDKTEFVGKQLADIVPGLFIFVQANELVYDTTQLTAARIIDPAAAESGQVITSNPPIDGQIEKIEGSTLTVKVAATPANSEEKTFSVRITDKTRFLKMEIVTKKGDVEAIPVVRRSRINLSDIRVGDSVSVVPNSEINNGTDFDAGSITINVAVEE